MRWFFVSLLGCHSDPPRSVGAIEGTDAVVGMILDGDSGLLYLCGGPETMNTLNRWFSISIDRDSLTGDSDGWTIDATRAQGDTWSGELSSTEGDAWSLELTPARGPDGPYTADGAASDCPAGAVVTGEGAALQGVICPLGLAAAQVVPVGIIGDEPGRIDVRTDTDPAISFAVLPASP